MNPKVKNILITKVDPNDYTKIGPSLYRIVIDTEFCDSILIPVSMP